MSQLLLFDEIGAGCSSVAPSSFAQILDGEIHRVSDPETSRIAAVEIVSSLCGLRLEFVDRLRQLGKATANEVARGNESVRKRARECERLGLIRSCGVGPCSVTGKQATIWEIVS